MLDFSSKKYELFGATNIGLKRRERTNQDSIYAVTKIGGFSVPPSFVVADGMGGHNGGDLASKIMIETMSKYYARHHWFQSPQKILRESVLLAHRNIQEAGKKEDSLAAMGTTVVAGIIHRDKLYLINVGDSRLYIITDQNKEKISYDHSVVAELVRANMITAEEADVHPKKNQLTMSVSARREAIKPYEAERKLKPDETIMLCSDGLWGAVPISIIQPISAQMKPKDATLKLVDLANQHGGPDNVSVIIIRNKKRPKRTKPNKDEDITLS